LDVIFTPEKGDMKNLRPSLSHRIPAIVALHFTIFPSKHFSSKISKFIRANKCLHLGLLLYFVIIFPSANPSRSILIFTSAFLVADFAFFLQPSQGCAAAAAQTSAAAAPRGAAPGGTSQQD